MTYPWEDPDAPIHIKTRQPVMEIFALPGPRFDLPKRRPADELSSALQSVDFGIVVMSHRGYSNGRLSVLLSSIPANYLVAVSSDSIAEEDVEGDRIVAEHHGAAFDHSTPWGGRAANARHCMDCTKWDVTLFLCDDVWLFPEAVSDALRWFYILKAHDVPLASLALPGLETYADHQKLGFKTWAECLARPDKFEQIGPSPRFVRTPALFKNPFGAAMVLSREAYNDLGGFATNYWAHDDVYNHKIWTSDRWVAAAYPGRGYMHLGAQSWHHGESVEYVGEFKDATGMTADESGDLQVKSIYRWMEKLGPIFRKLGGTPGV